MRSHLKFLGTILFALVFLVGGFFIGVSSALAATPGNVIINEFSSASDTEWVELLNRTGSDIPLSGWKIQDFTFDGATVTGVHANDINSVTIPANGMVVIEVHGLNDGADVITLYDNSSTPVAINNVVYGTVATQTTTTGLGTAPTSSQSAILTVQGQSASWSITATPTKGWFNNAVNFTCPSGVLTAPEGSSVPPTLSSIASCLASSPTFVATNMGTIENPSAATGLYFEKSVDGNPVGKITFAGPLNLTDSNTVTYLKAIGAKMEASKPDGAVRVGLNTTDTSSFSGMAGTVKMYGVSGDVAPALIIRNNAGDIVTPGGDNPTITPGTFNASAHTYEFTTTHFTSFETGTTINTAAIAGVTAPVTGGTPTATIADTTQYTATISWNGSPSTFTASTVYTATITITPKTSYTLTGVAANFFTVAGTSSSATNNINTGVVTAVFPATETGGDGNTSYALTYTAGTGGTITGTSPQTVSSGANGTAVTAVANSGYTFTNWSDGVNTASRTDTNIQANISVTASFTASIIAFDNPNYHYTNITNAPSGTFYKLAGLSPDGTKIVAQKSWNDGAHDRIEVVLMNTNGMSEAVVSSGNSGEGDIYGYMNPFWSDDGTAVGFQETHNAASNKIIRYDIATATLTYIYSPVATDTTNADFLGDSKTSIVFWTYGPVGGADLFTWDGTTRTNITNTSLYKEYEPISNADGTKIVYWSGETASEPVNTTHTLTYSGGVWTKDVGFTPIADSYYAYWVTPEATQIALTVMSSKDIKIYDGTGVSVTDLSGTGYSGGSGQWNFFGNMPQGSHGEFIVTSNAYRSDPASGRDIIIATPPTTVWVCGTGDCGHSGYSYNTIQSAIDAVAIGGTVNVATGNYTENVSINKSLTLIGAGKGTDPASNTILTQATSGSGITITSSDVTVSYLRIKDYTIGGTSDHGVKITGDRSNIMLDHIAVTNTAAGVGMESGFMTNITVQYSDLLNNRSAGLYVYFPAYVDGLTIDHSDIENNAHEGIFLYREEFANAADTSTNVHITNSTISHNAVNGDLGDIGEGNITLYGFNGNLEMSNVTVDATGADYGIALTGTYDTVGPAGTMSLADVSVTGTPVNKGIYISWYTEIQNLTFTDVTVNVDLASGLSDGGRPRAAILMRHVGNTYGINLGNTVLAGTRGTGTNHPYDLVASAANVNATGVTFSQTGNSNIENLVLHQLDTNPFDTGADPSGLVTFLSDTQTTPVANEDGTSDATLSDTTPEVVITNQTQPVEITIASGTDDAKIDVSSFVDTTVINGINMEQGNIPEITITSTAGTGNAAAATIEIPATTVTGPADWDGVIAAPTVTTVTLPVTSGETKTLSSAIELGFADAKLSFDEAVKILLPGQAGKRAGYVRPGTVFTEITTPCGENSQTWANDNLGADGECKIDSGSDLVIWTKHFTTFATYTQTAISHNSGGSFTPAVPAKVETPEGCAAGNKFSTTTGRNCNAATPAIGKVLGAEKFNFTILVKNGSKGNEIIELQKFLNTLGYTLVADGKFGPKTKGAVIKFQLANKLVGDGVVGAKTRAVLNK